MSAPDFHAAQQFEMDVLGSEAGKEFVRCFPLPKARALRDLMVSQIVEADPEYASKQEIERVALQVKGWEKDSASMLKPRYGYGLTNAKRTKLRLLVTLAKYIAALEREEVRRRLQG